MRQQHLPSCNLFPQQIGFEECVSILSDLILRAKKEASLNPSMPLESLVCTETLLVDVSVSHDFNFAC